MGNPGLRVAPLLFGSGLCALVYQIAWLRSLRLVFGASTMASAAVIGIFMGGLGLGGWLLGRRADRAQNPLALYAKLELGVAVAAAASPLLIMAVRALYLGIGGTQALGGFLGTALRLLLAAIIIGVPTVLAGGTLPAAVKAVERVQDLGRRQLGLIYAINTLGAVTGTFWATFVSLELLGTQATIWVAAALNAFVALVALRLSRGMVPEGAPAAAHHPEASGDAPATTEAAETSSDAIEASATPGTTEASGDAPATTAKASDDSAEALSDDAALRPASDAAAPSARAARSTLESAPSTAAAPRDTPATPPADQTSAPFRLVLASAAVVGFAFILMELVWYRMLSPILGGSSYTFGIILAVALLGIGLGGLLYAVGPQWKRPTMVAFSVTCGLEALLMIAPYALGDDLAVLAMVLRPWGTSGFFELGLLWTIFAAIVVLPAAIVAGYQFPLLVALLGTGGQDVGRQVGVTYAWNTGGSILGSLAGGFGLIPLLSAPGAWRLVVATLCALAAVCLLEGLRRHQGIARLAAFVPTAAIVLLAGVLMNAEGPTAFWRHTPIGVGKIHLKIENSNQLEGFVRQTRRQIVWEADGVESSVALHGGDGYGFIVHGKPDGNALGDASTQIMAGMVPAALHPSPRRALVIGLGTGTTAGWLAAIPTMERVDVIEMEAAIGYVGQVCAPVNHDAMNNPKVNLVIGDGREFLLTTDQTYDIIMSEPSNPYRAGIASLFTLEFYKAAAERLGDDGIMAQWVQAYDIQPMTVATIIATMGAVFPDTELWEVQMNGDMLLMGRKSPARVDLKALRARLKTEPYRGALWRGWRMDGAEGLYSGFVASAGFTADLRRRYQTRINTDDWTLIEFEFARSVGKPTLFSVGELRKMAQGRGQGSPGVEGLNLALVEELRTARLLGEKGVPPAIPEVNTPAQARMAARHAYARGDLDAALKAWTAQTEAPPSPMDITLLTEIAVDGGHASAPQLIDILSKIQPTESLALRARLQMAQGDLQGATQTMVKALESWRADPWAFRPLMRRTLDRVFELGMAHPTAGRLLFEALDRPFAVLSLENERLYTRLNLGLETDFEGLCVRAFAPLEPLVYWEEHFLFERLRCYQRHGHPLEETARRELARYREGAPVGIDLGDAPPAQAP